MKLLLVLICVLMVSCASSPDKAGEENSGEVTNTLNDSTEISSTPINEEPAISRESSVIEVPVPSKSELQSAFEKRDSKKIEEICARMLAKNPKDLVALNTLGLHHYRTGSIKLAKLIWDRAQRDYPADHAILNNLGVVYLNMKEEETAISFFKKALQDESSDPDVNFNIGTIYLRYKNYSLAETTLRQAYSKYSKSYAVANNYALALRGNGKNEDSMKVYESIINSNSKQYEALLNYATLLIYTNKSLDKAKDMLNRVKLMRNDGATLRYVSQLEQKIK